MDQRICEEGRQPLLDFKCKKIVHGIEKSTVVSPEHVQKPAILAKQNLELKIACQTPEKTNEPLHTKFKDGEVNLPDKWVAQCASVYLFTFFFFFGKKNLTLGIFLPFSDLRLYQSSLMA
jgi:hypothetical protein